MSILVNAESKVVVQGITGREGSFHTEQMRAFGTNVVAGVSPGKAGQEASGVPIFDTVADAVAATGADVAGVFVPPAFAADAIMESSAAGVPFTVCITEFIPVHDMVRTVEFVHRHRTRLLGANCPGIVTPAGCKVGIIPNHINAPGPVGIVGRSGTLTYEVIQGLSQAGIGQTTSVGIGGDPVMGLTFTEVLELFAADPDTEAVVMIGEIGG
ncbi:MAG: CoA-binding protein, partial [Candidatus Dormibacteraeota bacterium]|nr:CoA-binding protein [Candidatus Dormibacteraeota bacterium]